MPNEMMLIVYFLMWYFLVSFSLLFIISGLDDLFFDCYYWIRHVWRIWKTRHYKPLTYEQLLAKDEQLIAVLIPCWQEANVIATMLKHNYYSIDYKNYYFFVGVYPNDSGTVSEVQTVTSLFKNVRCVISETPGPSNKAANLNGIYRYIRDFEKTLGNFFDIFVFHDSEDVIHPMSFKLYNYLIPRKDMIQIPVFPLEVNNRNFTHWLYADEFAENHTKDIIVRESIHGHVPSAGVGTAFSRNTLKILEDRKTGSPFATDSLTEDYRTSLAVRVHALKQAFVTRSIIRMKWQRRGLFRKGYVQKPTREFIATRALFPLEYKKAIQQKARWIMGIVFQEWQHSRWPREWRICYTLAHDRKTFITHFINGFGYLIFAFWIVYSLFTYSRPEYPSLQEQFNLHPWTWWLIILVTLLMIERLVQRMIGVKRIYGWLPALLSIPRAFYGNILNLHALIRAYHIYYTTPKNKKTTKQPMWDKTEHQFPASHVLTPYRRKLGDLLLEMGMVSKEQLNTAILEQQKTGDRLGSVLNKLNIIGDQELLQVLSSQYNLSLFPKSKLTDNQHLIPTKLKKWLFDHAAIPVSIDEVNGILDIAIEDPTNELLIEKIINHITPFKAEFLLIDFTE